MKGSGLTSTLLNIMQNLLLIPANEKGAKSWLLAAKILRQISLNKAEIDVEDGHPVNMHNLLTV